MIICHRINTIAGLKEIPKKYGVEIDVRHDNRSGGLYLNHDPGIGDSLEEYLSHFEHAFIIFNIKESGTEETCRELAQKHNIPKEKYFLLDVEFPYVYQATRRGVREIALRYSEDEPIESFLAYKDRVNWLWIDTNTRLPLTKEVITTIGNTNTCLVCPERWGRPEDIPAYIQQTKEFNYKFQAVMTATRYANQWEESGVVSS